MRPAKAYPDIQIYDNHAWRLHKDTNVEENVFDKEAFDAAKAAYNKEEARVNDLFRSDLFELYEVTDNPKADKAFALAWDYGHSNGLSSVAHHFSEFVSLIKD